MVQLGYNYRLSDVLCAMGISQLRKLPAFLARRREIARQYVGAFEDEPNVRLLAVPPDRGHAYHLFPICLEVDRLKGGRAAVFSALRAEGIGVNVHYLPVHLHPFYRERYATVRGQCPIAEKLYERIITLPLFPRMTDEDVVDVVRAVKKVFGALAVSPLN